MNAANLRKISASYAGFFVRENPAAHELRPLFFYERFRECGALFPQLWNVEGALVFAQLFDDLVLYRQTVAVPAGNVGRRKAPHRFVAQDYVF